MRKALVVGVFFSFLLSFGFVQAEEARTRGASQTAQEQASDRAIFNRVTDWFATVGRSEEEKEQILEERKSRRLERQAEREAGQKQAEKKKEEAIQKRDKHRMKAEEEKAAREAEIEERKQEGQRQRPGQVPAGRR